MLYLAIDQHRKQLTVNLRNESGDVILKRQVSAEWPALAGKSNRGNPDDFGTITAEPLQPCRLDRPRSCGLLVQREVGRGGRISSPSW